MKIEYEKTKLLYLATPFTHSDKSAQDHRFRVSCRATAQLMKCGVNVFNPLSHSVPLVEHLGDVGDQHEFWMWCDLPILYRCDELLIVGMENWEQSRGVCEEMFKALAWRKPITLIEENDIELLPTIPATARRFLESSILPDAPSET